VTQRGAVVEIEDVKGMNTVGDNGVLLDANKELVVRLKEGGF
jgi:hypothetical protein